MFAGARNKQGTVIPVAVALEQLADLPMGLSPACC